MPLAEWFCGFSPFAPHPPSPPLPMADCGPYYHLPALSPACLCHPFCGGCVLVSSFLLSSPLSIKVGCSPQYM
ncbi:hypothetical protein BCR44DRAFT_1449397 [Catenaria anguillulae PL171]|uniref:Uncharacterized protein n=1 Tax=Catenaria anguillulae PL171 TaxID=765915 RepID=A0A1Y2H6E1_9FUNG|nr:hypothetical protein BCR44DRAFT_1449397 [Catenaria anguillulae PL171]